MNYKFLRNCHKLLVHLPEKVIMNPSEVSEFLEVSESYADTVIQRLREDNLADGFGTGPISRNNRTSTFPDFYLEKIAEAKDARKTKKYAFWGFWIAVTGIALQFLQWLSGLILPK